MSQNSINTPSIDAPYTESMKDSIAEINSKLDDLNSAVTDLLLLFSTQSEDSTDMIEKSMFEEGKKLRVELTKVIKTEIAAALTPHRRLVPAAVPKIQETEVDLTGDTTEEEGVETDTDESIQPTQKRSKLSRYTEH